MRLPLKKFQGEAVVELLRELADAQAGARRSRRQAIVLSAPTGAGKTVMAAALMESVVAGSELATEAEFTPDREVTFLWLSDDPDLNEQSRRRIQAISDGLPAGRFEVIETDLDQPTLDPGKVYFLNYQKLGSGALLGIISDRRSTTIWETIARTGRERPGKLIVIMDEAHKGLGRTAPEEGARRTIAAKFLAGGGAGTMIRRQDGAGTEQFPPVDLVVGISATAAKFNAILETDPTRVRRPVDVPPAKVRLSGLIKDDLVLYGLDEQEPRVWTLLTQAVAKVRTMEVSWADHGRRTGKGPVVPLLVVQVEDGPGGQRSATPLDTLLTQLALDWPELTADQVVHCFGDDAPVVGLNGWIVRRMHPNEIAAAQGVRVVLFKTALNTGWDCPRAEVLMSFRSAASATDIAQLVGRMVRTPLAERVEGDETLNETHLYLPRFNRERLTAVRDALVRDTGDAVNVRVGGEAVALSIRPGMEELHAALQGLPSVHVPPERTIPDLRRVFLLAHLLDQDGLGAGAVAGVAGSMVAALETALRDAADVNPDFVRQLQDRNNVRLTTLAIRDGEVEEREGPPPVRVSDYDIDRAFDIAKGVLGHEIAQLWLRRRFDAEVGGLVEAKLLYLELLRQPSVLPRLRVMASRAFDELRDRHWAKVSELDQDRVAQYSAVQGAGRHPQGSFLIVPRTIVVPLEPGGSQVDDHLFIVPDTPGAFVADLNGWELGVLAEERAGRGFLGFLRNVERAPWALSYAYQFNGWKPGYPDFLIFRRTVGGEIIVDVLEPHRGEDSVVKAKGMAQFAANHGAHYGRIQMIREIGAGVYRRLSLEDEDVRRQILENVVSAEDLIRAFEDLGTIGA